MDIASILFKVMSFLKDNTTTTNTIQTNLRACSGSCRSGRRLKATSDTAPAVTSVFLHLRNVTAVVDNLYRQLSVAMVLLLMAGICHMMSGGSGQHRVPPPWNPDDQSSGTFRAWVNDLMRWTMLTDYAPHQQAAAIANQLQGTARDMARTLACIMLGGALACIPGGPLGGTCRVDCVSFA